MSFITSLISFGVYWIFKPLFSLLLYIDGVVYSLVAYSYKLFMLMAQLNFNVVYAWVAPLIDRIKAIIMVLIMFKLGYSLIQYMINPDKLSDNSIGGVALIKNIAWCSILLISYTFIFSVMNELSLLIIGVPKGYEFTTLKEIADVTTDGQENDSGLIARFIFGTQADDMGDFGKYLATTTLRIFLHGKDNQGSIVENIYSQQANEDINSFDLTKITDVVSALDKTVEYKFPILSTAMAIYLIWSIVKLSIEIGVRMFKLIVLQIIAPVAIISIIDKGFNAKPWKKFINTYWKTWVDAFIRVASLFLVTAFISKFWTDRSALFPQIDGFTRYMVLIIVIFAAYRFAQLLPKFIDEIFGHSLSENNSKGFGKVLGGIAGFGLGAVGGLATGLAAKNGLGGILSNTIGGAFGGASSGSKGKNVADFFKGQAGNVNRRAGIAVENAQWKGKGGVAGKWANRIAGATGMAAIHDMNVGNELKSENKSWEQTQKDYEDAQSKFDADMAANSEDIDAKVKAMGSEASGFTYAGTSDVINFGTDQSAFVNAVANNDSDYIRNMDLAERHRRTLAQDKFADIVDSSGNTVTADYQRQMVEKSLRMAQNEAAKARRKAEAEASAAWKQKEQDSGITAARQREKDLARQKSESAERHRLEQRSHSERTKEIEGRKWGK